MAVSANLVTRVDAVVAVVRRDRTEAVDGVGDFERCAGFDGLVGAAGLAVLAFCLDVLVEGVGEFRVSGCARPLPLSTIALEVVVLDAGSLDGDVGLGSADVVAVDAVVLVVRTERTDADEEAVLGAVAVAVGRGVARVMSGLGGPLICLAGRAEVGVGLALLSRERLPMDTRVPRSAAVGLRAVALPGTGAVAGPETDRPDRALLTDVVDAELLSRSRRRPGASSRVVVLGPAGTSARTVDGRDDAVVLDAAERTLAASDRDMTREVVRGRPALVLDGPATRLRANGEMADWARRSSSRTSTSAQSAPLLTDEVARTIADLFEHPMFQVVESTGIPDLHPSFADMGEDTFSCRVDLLSRLRPGH